MQIQPPARPRARLVKAVACAAALSIALATATWSSPGAASPPPGSSVVRAAFYFGSANPVDMWSSDLHGANAAFRKMRADGFSAVELPVPWGEFQEHVNPASYNTAAFTRLGSLVAIADSLHLQVVLRLSYGQDVDPNDRSPDRFVSLFSDPAVYRSWLGYITRVHQTIAKYHNVKIAQLSWEDFWQSISDAQRATTVAERMNLATTTGYRAWLRVNYSLAAVSSLYRTTFTSWSDVPTPPSDDPNFSLMFRYFDWALVHRLFMPAAARFPGLNLEARVDADPLYSGSNVVGSYPHDATFTLPGTSYIGMYFAPYLGDPSTSKTESASSALTALQTMLASMRARSGNRRLFIFEYEIVSNSLEVASNPALPPKEISPFLLASAPILARFTLGYSLWTYRDYHLSPLYNPDFALGTQAWRVTGASKPARSGGGPALSLAAGSKVQQQVPLPFLNIKAGPSATVTFDATSSGSAPALLDVSLGGGPAQRIVVAPGTGTYHVQQPIPATGTSATLAISAVSPVTIAHIRVYNYSQIGDVYTADGTPAIGAAPLRTMNQELALGTATGVHR